MNNGLQNEYRLMNNSINRRAAFRALEDATMLNNAARDALAASEVLARGLTGDAAYFFTKGCEGWDIKKVNPRKEGFLAEFNAGVSARKTAGL